MDQKEKNVVVGFIIALGHNVDQYKKNVNGMDSFIKKY